MSKLMSSQARVFYDSVKAVALALEAAPFAIDNDPLGISLSDGLLFEMHEFGKELRGVCDAYEATCPTEIQHARTAGPVVEHPERPA